MGNLFKETSCRHLKNKVAVITGSKQCLHLLVKKKSKQFYKIHTCTVKKHLVFAFRVGDLVFCLHK